MVAVLLARGNFSRGLFDGWMKTTGPIGYCTDGIRPAIFRVEGIDE